MRRSKSSSAPLPLQAPPHKRRSSGRRPVWDDTIHDLPSLYALSAELMSLKARNKEQARPPPVHAKRTPAVIAMTPCNEAQSKFNDFLEQHNPELLSDSPKSSPSKSHDRAATPKPAHNALAVITSRT